MGKAARASVARVERVSTPKAVKAECASVAKAAPTSEQGGKAERMSGQEARVAQRYAPAAKALQAQI